MMTHLLFLRAMVHLSGTVMGMIKMEIITYKYVKEDPSNLAVLYKIGPQEIDQRILVFSPRMQGALQEGIDKKDVVGTYLSARDNLVAYDDETEKEFLRKIGD